MSDIKTFSNFKDWALILLVGGNFATQINLNSTVNEQTKVSAVHEVILTKLESDVADLKREQRETQQEITRIKEYLKPSELKEKSTVNR